MLSTLKNKSVLMFSLGLSAGLLVCAGMAIGLQLKSDSTRGQLHFPDVPLHAVAADSAESFAIATGPIAEGVEGLFMLDFLTGELNCAVINPRTGALGGMYKYNVVADLGVQQGKKPSYLMVTGMADFRYGGATNVRPAESVVYVADANTGKWAAYMLPWNRTAASFNAAQVSPLVLLGKGAARTLEINE